MYTARKWRQHCNQQNILSIHILIVLFTIVFYSSDKDYRNFVFETCQELFLLVMSLTSKILFKLCSVSCDEKN